MPEGRDTPQAWLAPDAAGITHIRDELDDEARVLATLAPGETVAFVYMERLGSAEVTIMPDGTWTGGTVRDRMTVDMFDGPPPERPEPAASQAERIGAATLITLREDSDVHGDTMDEFARTIVELEPPPEGCTTVEIDLWFWSPKQHFRISPDGASLEPCPATEGEG
jgi:hypothetical protein